MKYLLIALLLITGCASYTKNVKVLTSQSEITVRNLQIEEGDRLICDPEGCRIVR